MRQNRKEMANEMDNYLKEIIKDIKKNYFVLLSSLKFENISEKKAEKDYKVTSMNPKEVIETDPTYEQIRILFKKKLAF